MHLYAKIFLLYAHTVVSVRIEEWSLGHAEKFVPIQFVWKKFKQLNYTLA